MGIIEPFYYRVSPGVGDRRAYPRLLGFSVVMQAIGREENVFQEFLRMYALSNPRPKFGWYIKVTAIAIIALMMVAALRTAFSFGLAAMTSLNQFMKGIDPNLVLFLSGLEAVASVLGIEGFIITTGMKAGMKKKESELETPRAVAAYILLAVSCAAGMFQNATMLGTEVLQVAEWVLMGITAVGIPVSLMFAAPYLGLMMNFQSMEEQHWFDKARESFNNSKERKLIRRDLVQLPQNPTRVFGRVKAQRSESAGTSGPTSAEIISWYRNSHNLTSDDQVNGTEVASAWYQENNLTPVNGDLNKLATPIRVALHRERKQ
jgi:hypothetical protein